MVWAAFSSFGKIGLAFTSSKMDSNEYQGVLQQYLLPFIKKFRRHPLIFQQDNAPIHKSASTTNWLRSKKINLMEWPACSPDCNPIENVWSILVRRIYANGKQYNNTNELKTAISTNWDSLEQEVLDNLVKSMPNRIFQLIQNKGATINY